MSRHRDKVLSAWLKGIADQVSAHSAAGIKPSLSDLGRLAAVLYEASAAAKVLERRVAERAADELRRALRSKEG